MSLRAIVLFSLLLPSLPFCLARPFYGIICWTIIGFLNPQFYAWGARFFAPAAELVAIPTLVGCLLFGRNWRALATREVMLLGLLYGWFTVTTIVATNTPLFMPHAQDTWIRWETVAKILVMTAATIVCVENLAKFRTFLIVLSGCVSVFIIKAIPFVIVTGGSFRLHGPEKTAIEDNNDFGLALNMTLPMFFFLAQSEERVWLKRFYWALFICTIPCIFFTYSRGAMVGLCVIMLMMLMRLRNRVILIPVILLGMVIAALFAPDAWKERMNPTGEQALDMSALSRINAWKFAWRLAGDYPITGGGFATFTPQLFARYADNALDVHGAHSVYFGVLGEHGFPGLLLYLALIASCFSTLRWVRKRGIAYEDDLMVNYADMFTLSLVGFLVSGCFLGRAYFDYYFTLVACIVILKRVARKRWMEMDLAGEDVEPEEVEAEASPVLAAPELVQDVGGGRRGLLA